MPFSISITPLWDLGATRLTFIYWSNSDATVLDDAPAAQSRKKAVSHNCQAIRRTYKLIAHFRLSTLKVHVWHCTVISFISSWLKESCPIDRYVLTLYLCVCRIAPFVHEFKLKGRHSARCTYVPNFDLFFSAPCQTLIFLFWFKDMFFAHLCINCACT